MEASNLLASERETEFHGINVHRHNGGESVPLLKRKLNDKKVREAG